MKRALCLMALGLLGAPAIANDLIIVEPDDFAPNANISAAVPGVTLSTVDSDMGEPAVFARPATRSNWAGTGTMVFGHLGEYSEHWITDRDPNPDTDPDPGYRYGALQVDFASDVKSVSIALIANDFSDTGEMFAYDAAGHMIGYTETPVLQAGPGAAMTLTLSGIGPIHSIVVGGSRGETVCLDHLVAEVPEPTSAMALLVLAALGRRR